MRKASSVLAVIVASAFVLGGCGTHPVGKSASSSAKGQSGQNSWDGDWEEESGLSLGGSGAAVSGGAGKDGNGGGNNNDPQNKNPKRPGTTKTITIWGEYEDGALFSMVDDYAKTHPEVYVNVETVSSMLEVSTFKTAVAAGRGPDGLRMDHVYITGLGEEGLLTDLTQLNVQSQKSRFIPSCWSAVTYGKKVYGLPHDGNTIAMCYNKTLIQKWTGHDTYPKTYQDIIDIGKQKSDPKLFAFTTPFFDKSSQNRMNWAAFNFFIWLWGNGGNILSSDYKHATFNSQAGVDALNQIIRLTKTEKICDETYREPEFYNGDVGMIEMGNWVYDNLNNSAVPFKFGVAMLPELKKGVKPYSGLGLYAYGVSASSKHKKETYDFLLALCTNKAYQLQYAKQYRGLPVTEAAVSDPYYKEGKWKVFVDQYRQSKARPGVKNWAQIEQIISSSVLNGIQSGNAKSALDAAAAQVNALL